MRAATVLIFALGGFLLAGCTSPMRPGESGAFGPLRPGGPVYAPQEMVVEKPMPATPPFGTYFEESKAAPSGMTDPYWIRGYWGWKNSDWEWIPGRWVERPKPGLLWINARSYSVGPRVFWVTGYWE